MVDAIKEIISAQIGCSKSDINMDTSYNDDLNISSIDIYEISISLEEMYDIEIPTEDIDRLTTVQATIDYLKERGIS